MPPDVGGREEEPTVVLGGGFLDGNSGLNLIYYFSSSIFFVCEINMSDFVIRKKMLQMKYRLVFLELI